jgi:hypothetical protein
MKPMESHEQGCGAFSQISALDAFEIVNNKVNSFTEHYILQDIG